MRIGEAGWYDRNRELKRAINGIGTQAPIATSGRGVAWTGRGCARPGKTFCSWQTVAVAVPAAHGNAGGRLGMFLGCGEVVLANGWGVYNRRGVRGWSHTESHVQGGLFWPNGTY